MTEFLPEDVAPDAGPIAYGAALQAPQRPVHVAPPGAQFAPPAQPYGQPVAPPTAPQYATWGAPPPAWNPPAPRRRKAWPWVVGSIGVVVVLAVVAVAAALGVNSALNADQNPDYAAAPIAAGDVPTLGDQLLVSDDGALAFEIGREWVDANELTDVPAMLGELPEGGSIMAAYFTFDPALAVDKPPSFVVVIEGAPPDQVGPLNVSSMHTDFMSGALDSIEGVAQDVESAGPDAVTTANGLDGKVSTISCEVQGIPVRSYIYTFARGERVAFIQIFSYTDTYDVFTAELVTDSFRIDK